MKSWVSRYRQVARLTVLGLVALSGSFGAGAAHAGPDPEAACVPSAGFTHCERYSATGADQSFTVPAGVSSVDVRIWGAGGGGSNTDYYLNQRAAGGGGFTTGTLAVTAGRTFTVSAGQGGVVNGTAATYGGGGAGGGTPRRNAQGASGGGLSALWDGGYGSTPLLVAGGGGGISPGSDGQTPYGGAGGGASGTADNQPGISGRGGSQAAGGAAATGAYCSTRAQAGARYQGGTGGITTGDGEGGGGGGGGYFGGGGGACQPGPGSNTGVNGDGGGGSGYTGGAGVTGATTTAGGVSTANNVGGTAAGTSDDQYVAGVGVGGGATNGGGGQVVLQWVTRIGLSVTKTMDPKPYVPGQTLTYTVEVANAGPAPAVGARVRDTLPANLKTFTWTCAATAGSTCATASGTGDIDALVTLAASGKATFTVTGKVPSGATGTITNTATVTRPDAAVDPNCTPTCSSSVSGTSAAQADLVMTKALGSNATVAPGETFAYTLTVENKGPSDAVDAKATDTLPTGLTFESGTGCAAVGQAVTCGPEATLVAGGSRTWTFTVRLAASYTGGDLRNTATASSATPDPVPGNNTSAQVSPPPVAPKADVSIVKAFAGAGPVAPGTTFEYTLTVANAGPSDARQVVVADTLPAQLTFVGSTSGCSAAVSCPTIGTLAAGTSTSYRFTVRLDAGYTGDGSDLTNVATANATTSDPVAPNNTSRLTGLPGGTGAPETALSVTKTGSAEHYVPGQAFTYTITARNAGPSVARAVRVTDSLPAGLKGFTWQCAATAPDACGAASGTGDVDTTVTLAVGGLATFTVTGTVPPTVSGDLSNTATLTPPAGTVDKGCSPDCSATETTKGPKVTLTKSVLPAAPKPGDTVTYTVAMVNNGTADHPDFRFTDDLTGVLDDTTWVGTGATGGGTFDSTGLPALRWNGPVPAGTTVTVTYQVRVKTPPGGDGVLTNKVVAAGTDCVVGTEPGCTTTSPEIPGVTMAKTMSPTAPRPGDIVTYTVTLVNATGADFAGFTFTDDLTDVEDDATWQGPIVTDPAGAATSAAHTSPTVSWAGTVAAKSTVTVRYTVRVDDHPAGNRILKNKVVSTNTTCQTGTEPGCSTTTDPLPSVTVAKALTPTTPVYGQPVTYTVTLRNTGPTGYPGFTFTDNLAGVLDDATWDGPVDSGGGTFTKTGPDLRWQGDVPAGATVTVSYRLVLNGPPTGDRVLTNTVVATGSNCVLGTEPGCTTSTTVPPVTGFDASVVKAPSATGARIGDTVTYTVTVRNLRTYPLKNLTVTDDLTHVTDKGTYNADADASITGVVGYAAPLLTWTGDLPAGVTLTLTYSVTVTSAGDKSLVNTVSVPGSDCPPGGAATNCKATVGVATLTFTKTSAPARPVPGGTVTYTVVVHNDGLAGYPDATFTDDLSGILDDGTLNPGSPGADSGTASVAGNTLTWKGTLAPGAKATVTYVVTLADPPTGDKVLRNKVVSTSTGTNCPPGSTDPKCGGENQPGLPYLDIVKTAAPAVPGPGGTVTYTIRVTNSGKATYQGAALTDTLNGVLDDADYNGDVRADAGTAGYTAPDISWTGDVPVGATVTITYSVRLKNPETGDRRLRNQVVATGGGTSCPLGSANQDCTTETPTPPYDLGDAPDSYGTRRASGGAVAQVVDGLRMGPTVTAKLDAPALLNGLTDPSDDALVAADLPLLVEGRTGYALDVPVTNSDGRTAQLTGWIDADRDGTFGPAEQATAPVPTGASTVRLVWSGLDTPTPGATYLRLRLNGDQLAGGRIGTEALVGAHAEALPATGPTGFGGYGEVEDYPLTIAPGPVLPVTGPPVGRLALAGAVALTIGAALYGITATRPRRVRS